MTQSIASLCDSRRSGYYRNSICIWGHGDLPFLQARPELFVNKLIWNRQPFALDCLEQWFWSRTVEDFAAGPYSPLPAPLGSAQLRMPETLDAIWPPPTLDNRSVAERSPAPSRIDLEMWQELYVVQNHL